MREVVGIAQTPDLRCFSVSVLCETFASNKVLSTVHVNNASYYTDVIYTWMGHKRSCHILNRGPESLVRVNDIFFSGSERRVATRQKVRER